jgi:LmbE family N-acetylglucosaminyl deacetylase
MVEKTMKGLSCLFLCLGIGLGWCISTNGDTGTGVDKEKELRVVVFGAHPDDPESGCGGLIALLTQKGHEVIVGYATCYRGDRKIGGEPEAVVRRREATAACKLLGASAHFFDYAHENLVADHPTLEAITS